jgi:cysteinyl-tRNA synthetase
LGKIEKLGTEIGSVDEGFKNKFLEYLLDDFNVSKTLSLISEILKSDLSNEDKLATILEFDAVWGLDLKKVLEGDEKKDVFENVEENLPEDVKKILNERIIARKNKDFAKSDELRLKLEERGYKIQDSSDGGIVLFPISK